MKNLIFIGGGGFFLELYDYIQDDYLFLKKFKMKGVLDDNEKLDQALLPYLGTISSYQPRADDVFLVTLGNVINRDKFFRLLEDKGAEFITYLHPSSIVSRSALMGKGCIVAPGSIVNAKAIVENNVVINVHCSVGHESKIGFSSVLSPYSAVNGNAVVGSQCFLGTRATVFPGKEIGNKGIIDSHSYVKSDVPEKSIVSVRGDYVVVKNRLMR